MLAETFVGAILNNLMALAPFVMVLSYQRGVRWKWGKNPVALEPGFHLRCWLMHKVEISDMTDCAIELPIQSVMTADEKLLCFSANIGYRISDVVAHWQSVHDFESSTAALAMTHLAERVRGQNLSEVIADQSKLEKSLRGTLTTKFKNWGTEVFAVGFTNFAEVNNQFRIFTDGGINRPHIVLPI